MMIHHKDFARRTGYNPEYISEMIRTGKLQGEIQRYKGRQTWFVDDSLIPQYIKNKAERQKRKSGGAHSVQKKIRAFKSDLDRDIAELEEYNKKHGTALSYGQYMSIKSRAVK